MSDQRDSTTKIPSWLTKEYIGKIFSEYGKRERKEDYERKVDIDLFEESANYVGTQLFKVKATNKKITKDVYKTFMKIITKMPTSIYSISNQTQVDWSKREGEMYDDFIKYITGILSKNMPEVLLPKLYHYSEEPFCLLIEDMTYRGYEICKETYTFEQCTEVFRNLARFHALSYYAHHQLKKNFTKYNNTFMPKDNVPVIVSTLYGVLYEVVKTWEGCLEYGEKLEKFEAHYTDSLTRCLEPNAPGEGYNVLVYGDIHKNNILFNKDLTKCVIIDYQFSGWRSPGVDLIGAFNSLCEPDDNLNSRDILIKYYHDEFKDILKRLNFSQSIPTLFDVHREVLKSGIFEIFCWTAYAPYSNLDHKSDPNKTTIENMRDIFNCERHRNIAKHFPRFFSRGYCDVENF